jgi:GNAT superfamily N-acetyltransferase
MSSEPWSGRLSPPAAIDSAHDVSRFDSGEGSIDDFLKKHALKNHQEQYSLVVVLADQAGEVFGYYALAYGSIARNAALPRKHRHGAPSEIPAIILARLGVDRRVQGRGIGKDLLGHAIRTVLWIAEQPIANVSPPFAVMAIKALDAARATFYAKHGFRSFDATRPLDLVRRIKDLAADQALATAILSIEQAGAKRSK